MIFTPKFPLVIGDSSMQFTNADLKDIVLFHLKNVILTSPGEKITDPSYGVGIKRYLFENLTTGTLNLISNNISRAISKYLSYLNLIDVEVFSIVESAISVRLRYTIPTINEVIESSFDVSSDSSSY